MASDYYSFDEVLRQLQLEEEDLHRMTENGVLHSLHIRGKMCFRKREIDAFKERMMAEPTNILPISIDNGGLLLVEENTSETIVDIDDTSSYEASTVRDSRHRPRGSFDARAETVQANSPIASPQIASLSPFLKIFFVTVVIALLYYIYKDFHSQTVIAELRDFSRKSEDSAVVAQKLLAIDAVQPIEKYIAQLDNDFQKAYFFSQQRHRKQANELLQALRKQDRDANSNYILAHCYENLKSLRDAAYHYEKAIEMAPQEGFFHACLARTYHQLGEEKDALHYYQQAKKHGYFPLWVKTGYTKTLVAARKYSEAREELQQLQQQIADSYHYYYLKGILAYKEGEFREALASFAKSRKLGSDVELLYQQGRLYYDLGQYPKAGKFFLESLKYQKSAPIYLSLAQTYAQVGNRKKAFSFAQKALSLASREPQIFKLIAEIHCAEKEYSKALSACQRAIQVASDKGPYYAYKALVLLDSGEEDYQMLLQASTLSPNNPEVFFIQGHFYKKLKKYTLAINAWQNAVELAPHYWQAHQELAVLFEVMKDVKQAQEQRQKTAKINPFLKGN